MNKTGMKIFAAAALLLICSAASAQPPDTLDIKRSVQFKSPLGNSALPGKFRIFEATSSGSQRIEFRAPVSMPVNVNLILPITQPSSGNVLTALTSDSLGWSTPSGTGDITGVAAGVGLAGGGSDGDVTLNVIYAATAGNADTLTLHDFITGAPSTNDFIKWNGANWVPAAGSGGAGDIEGVTAGTGLSGGGTSGTVTLSADSTSWVTTDYSISLRQLKSDTATYDASKTWVLGKSYLVAGDIAGKQDDSDTTSFDATKTYVNAQGFLKAVDIATKQDDADTNAFDATKTWVLGKNYLIAADIAAKQDDSDTLTFDATKNYVNTRGFLTTETGDISEVVAGNGISGGGITGSVTVDLNPKLAGQTIAITSDSTHIKTASLDSSHVKALGLAGSDLAAATITGDKLVMNTLGPTQINETASYFFSNTGNLFRALSMRPDTLALQGAVTITSVKDTVVFRKANGSLAFKIYTGASPTADQILKANGDKVLVFGSDVSGGGGGGGSFRVRDDGSSISSTPQSLDFRAGLQAIAAGTDSLEIYIAANRGIKAATDTLQILRTLTRSGLAFKSDSVMVDTASVVIQTKTEVSAQITTAIATKQDDSDTTAFDATKTYVNAQGFLKAADVATKQDDADTNTFDASKTWVLGKNYLVAADIATKQDDADTNSFDASKTWVLGKNYLVAADIANKQDDSDTTSFDATKTYVNSRGFLTTVATGNIVDGTITGDDINPNIAGSGLVLTVSTPDVLDFAPSELLNVTFSNGGSASGSITFNLNGTTDPVISFTDGIVNVSAGALQEGGSNVFTAADGSLADDDLSNNLINDLNDVTITTAAAAQILVRNIGNTAWENVAMSSEVTIAATGAATIAANAIDSTNVTAGSIAGSDIINGAIINAKLAAEAVDSTKIKTGHVTSTDIKDANVNPSDMALSQNFDWTGAHTIANAAGFSFKPHGVSTGNTSEARFLELAANGTNYIAFKAPDALATTTIYMLPRKGGATTGQVLHINATQDSLYWDADDGAGGGAPIDADYLVGTANGSLTNEIVVGTTPGGELGNTWASPTIDADAVTNAKLANMAQNTIKMRVTAGAGDPEDIDISTSLTLVTAASGDYVVIEDATDGGLKRVDVGDFLGGGVAWSAIADAAGLGSIDFAGFDQDIVSAEDGGDILTVTNSDAVHAATSRILVLADNDGANANAVYLQMIGDADGTPTNDYIFSQTGFTSLFAVNVPAEAYDATNWDADTGAPQKDAVRDQFEGYTGRNTIVTVGTIATGTWNATVIDEAKLDLTLTTTALNASGVTTTLGTVAGTIDAGGATSFEIPNAANPTTSGEAQIAWDSNNDALEVHNGTDSRILAIRIKSIQATIVDPDVVQPIIDAVSIFSVETEMFPFGITLISCGIKTNASSTYSVNFEEWTSPTDGAPATIELVATASTTEAEDDGTLSDASIAAGSIIKVDLPTTDIAELVVWITYVINEGN